MKKKKKKRLDEDEDFGFVIKLRRNILRKEFGL